MCCTSGTHTWSFGKCVECVDPTDDQGFCLEFQCNEHLAIALFVQECIHRQERMDRCDWDPCVLNCPMVHEAIWMILRKQHSFR